nr:hypothetical protein CFP56_25060 [Quercus suber]
MKANDGLGKEFMMAWLFLSAVRVRERRRNLPESSCLRSWLESLCTLLHSPSLSLILFSLFFFFFFFLFPSVYHRSFNYLLCFFSLSRSCKQNFGPLLLLCNPNKFIIELSLLFFFFYYRVCVCV